MASEENRVSLYREAHRDREGKKERGKSESGKGRMARSERRK
jgi:hypothetical protein